MNALNSRLCAIQRKEFARWSTNFLNENTVSPKEIMTRRSLERTSLNRSTRKGKVRSIRMLRKAVRLAQPNPSNTKRKSLRRNLRNTIP